MTYGPTNPITTPGRSRTSDARRGNLDAYRSWSEYWFIGYLVIIGLLGGTYIINHIFGWGGMIANTFIFMVYAMILAPVLTAPSVGVAVTIAGLLGRNVPQAFKTYLGSIAPNIAFWSLLALGSTAWFPWHLGAWWAGPLVMAVSLFLVVHAWKYVAKAKTVKTLSLWYAVGVLVVALVFALGADKFVADTAERINPPAAFSQDKVETNWVMDMVTGEEFKHLSPTECAETVRGFCVNPDTGVRLIPYNTAIVDSLTRTRNGPTPTRTPDPVVSAIPNDVRISSLKSCNLGLAGWSEEIPVEDGFNISPGYSLESLEVQYLTLSNGWVDEHPGSGNFISMRFCASNDRIVGRSMGVKFLPKT